MRGAFGGAVVLLAGAMWWAVGQPRWAWEGVAVVYVGALCVAAAWASKGPTSLTALGLAALAVRVAMWGAGEVPALSEDWVRYAWDGWVVVQGHWPTGVVPAQWQASPPVPWPPVANEMLAAMNSAHYPGVYPPLAQGVFALPWWLGVETLGGWWRAFQGGVVVVDSAAVLGLAVVLRQLGISERRAAWYAFHPAVLVEGTGNGHLEVLVVAAGVAAVLAWQRKRRWALGWGAVAIGLKWLPVLALPAWVAWRWEHRKREWPVWAGLVALAVAFAGLAWVSMRLFVDRFEFNAGPYYVVRNLVMHWTGHNPIRWLGPALMVAGAAGVGWAALRLQWSLGQRWAAGWGLWLALATTVHPWYLLYLVPLGVVTPWRWPQVAAGVGVLSYAHYARLPYDSGALVASWAVVGLAVGWDIWHARKRNALSESPSRCSRTADCSARDSDQ